MKILIIQVGNFVPDDSIQMDKQYLRCPTLLHGDRYFEKKAIINNVQTRQSIEDAGNEVVYYFNTDRRSFKDLWRSARKIRLLTKNLKPDITHIYWGGMSGLMGSLMAKGKTIVSFLGSDMYGSYSAKGKKTKASLIQILASRLTVFVATGIVVMSERMKIYLGAKERIVVIPEGISLEKFYPKDRMVARTYLNWKRDSFILIFFYEGQGVKNFALAEKVAKILKDLINNFEFKIIEGYNHEDLVDVYNAADCLLLTSYHEGSNNSIKESIACNLPVVSVPCGDAEERLEGIKNCYVSEYDSKDLANSILRIYQAGERANGCDYVGDITLDESRNRLIRYYNSLF